LPPKLAEHSGGRKLNPSEAHPTGPAASSQEGDTWFRRRAALTAFLLIALTIAVSDQLLKHWVVANYALDVPSPVIGDWLRIDYIHNRGGLFGLFQGSALLFAFITLAVAAVLAGLEFSSGWRSWIVTVTLGLLLGGAIGNFIDRITVGYVVDFADIGIGTWRFYIFNIADSAVTVAILLMLAIWILGPFIGLHVNLDVPGARHDAAEAARHQEAVAAEDAKAGVVVRDRTPHGEGR
jgi:signal peptidase II